MASKRFVYLLSGLIGAWLASGCDDSVRLSDVAGHFEGFVAVTPAANAPVQASAHAEIQKTSDRQLTVSVSIGDGSGSTQSPAVGFTVSFVDKDHLKLASPTGAFDGELTLARVKGDCFSDVVAGATVAKDELCLSGREVQVALTGFRAPVAGFVEVGEGRAITKIVLDKMSAVAALPLEQPQSYTIDDLMKRARERNFDNQVELENLVQAKLAANVAYANLAPHINVTTGLAVGSAYLSLSSLPVAALSIVKAIGDLLPFVLPSRWYQAEALNASAEAENDALRIVQGSSMNVVQTLALSVLRDEQTLEVLNENKLQVIQLRDMVLMAEQEGPGDIQLGSANQINVILNAVDSSIVTAQETLQEELTALSQGAGFMNPHAVTVVEPVVVAPITGPIQGDEETWQQLAAARSLILQQMDHLEVYAAKTKSARQFAWLDPSGDDQGSLGFGIVDYFKVGSSMMRQVVDKRDSAASQLRKKVADTLSASEMVYAHYGLMRDASRLNQSTIDRIRLDFTTGLNFIVGDLAQALQGKAAADVAGVADEYSYLQLLGQIDFLTFTNEYAPLVGTTR